MPKKKATRKKATRKATRKKATRKVTRKGAAKRPVRKTNKTELKLELKKGSAVDGGPQHAYDVVVRSTRSSVTAGTVVAKTETEAKSKAKRLLRTLV